MTQDAWSKIADNVQTLNIGLMGVQSHIIEAVIALLLSSVGGLLIGPIAGRAVPFFWILCDMLFGGLGERLDKPKRRALVLVGRGIFLTVLVLGFSALVGGLLETLCALEPLKGLAPVLFLCLFFASGSVWFALGRLYRVMDEGNPKYKARQKGGYYAMARSTRINLAVGDAYGIARAGLGFVATSFDKGVVAPAFWYILGGFTALGLYSGLSFLVWRFGKRGFTKGFGRVPIFLERVMGIVPSFLSALCLIWAALFTPTAKLHRGFVALWGRKNRAPYEEGGWPLSALAWSLSVSLGGAVQEITGSAIQGVWVGPENATARIGHRHLRRGLYISVIAHLLFFALLLGCYKGL